MLVELKKSTFGFSQNAKVKVENKPGGVYITVLEADYPSLIDHEVICKLVNDHKGEYSQPSRSMKDNKREANSGFLHERVEYLKSELEKAEFARLVAKRNKVFVFNETESKV